jgi:hypothetical protein
MFGHLPRLFSFETTSWRSWRQFTRGLPQFSRDASLRFKAVRVYFPDTIELEREKSMPANGFDGFFPLNLIVSHRL